MVAGIVVAVPAFADEPQTTTTPPAPTPTPSGPPSLTPARSHALPYTMWPEEMEFDSTKRPPDGYTLVHRRRKGLIIGGAIAFGVAYTFSAYRGLREPTPGSISTGTEPSLAVLAVPIAGPFIVALSKDYDDGSESFQKFKIVLAGAGCAQVAGAIMLYLGLTSERPILVRSDLVSGLRLTPMAGSGTSGLALSGGF